MPLGAAARETLEQRFDKRVYDRARESMRDRDRNRNEVLDGEEWKRGDWDPPLADSDLNKDGIIDLEEMCMRYQNRELGRNNKLTKVAKYVMDPPPLFSFPAQAPGSPAAQATPTVAVTPTWPPAAPAPSAGSQPASEQPRFFGWFGRGPQEGRWPPDGRWSMEGRGEWDRQRWEFARQRDGERSPAAPEPARSEQPLIVQRSYRQPTPQERLPDGLPNWFYDHDADFDGQISMAEFLGDDEITEAAAGKFQSLDRSGDGLVSGQECLEVMGSGRSTETNGTDTAQGTNGNKNP